MEDEVVRIAKKMDKMVQKKNAVSAAGGAGRQGGRAAGGGQKRWAPGGPARPCQPSPRGQLRRIAPAAWEGGRGGRPRVAVRSRGRSR